MLTRASAWRWKPTPASTVVATLPRPDSLSSSNRSVQCLRVVLRAGVHLATYAGMVGRLEDRDPTRRLITTPLKVLAGVTTVTATRCRPGRRSWCEKFTRFTAEGTHMSTATLEIQDAVSTVIANCATSRCAIRYYGLLLLPQTREPSKWIQIFSIDFLRRGLL